MRCFIAGGGGFIGSHLGESLLAAGHQVVVFDRQTARYLDNLSSMGADIRTGNFLNSDDLSRSIVGCDVVFHLVSTTVPQTSNENPIFDAQTNLLGTLTLLESAKEAGVKKIIFSSSGGTVYGITREIPIKENHPTEPISAYGITKLAIEKYLYLYWYLYKLDYCVLRVANAYGERQPVTDTQGIIAVLIDKTLKKEEITIWGDGSIRRDFVYVTDIANAFLKAISYTGVQKVINVSSGRAYSLNDILAIVERLEQNPLRVKYTFSRDFDVPINVLDNSLAKQQLNWQPSVDLSEGVTRMYNWMKKENGQ